MGVRWTRVGSAASALAAAMMLAACGGSETASQGADDPASSAPQSHTDPSDEASQAQQATPAAESPAASEGAADGFRAWLAASRKPDAQAACAGLSPALQKRMLTQLQGAASTCPEMMTMTAAAFKAAGQSADVEIEVRDETPTDATLFVTYLGTKKCGTIVMERPARQWVITEQSEQCQR